MKTKIYLLSLSLLGAVAATAAGTQNPLFPRTGPPDDDGHKFAVFIALTNGQGGATSNSCNRQAWVERKAARREANSDFMHDLALCVNIEDPDEQWECVLEAFDSLDEALEELEEQFLARLDLCDAIGGGHYEPEIDPEQFTSAITNPLLSYTPGVTYVYELVTDEETEIIHVTPTEDTREIMGVECAVVRDTVWIDGEMVEDTLDYFAQDDEGNVWYFGELSFELEDGNIVALEGSWIAGENGAHPGIVMFDEPLVGTTYRQEYELGGAEDVGTILALNETVDVPYGNFAGCLQTLDFSPLEPGAEEYKFYFPGVGLVLEIDPESGDRLELIDIL